MLGTRRRNVNPNRARKTRGRGLRTNTGCPASTGAASWDQPVGVATARWFDMLAGDADFEFDPSVHSETGGKDFEDTSTTEQQFPQYHQVQALAMPNPRRGRPEPDFRWQASSPLTLKIHEQAVFDYFVTHISQWLDLFDPYRYFSSLVPKLALHNVGLLNAILSLSIRHTTTCQLDLGQLPFIQEDALYYYNESLQYLQKTLQYETYHTSDELLATTLIISAFEMLGNGSSRDWERHLQGVFWIQRAQVIHGDSGGLRGAVWWAWICQDVWAAFRDKRKVFSFWKPERILEDLNPTELAARSVFVLARIIDFCALVESDVVADNIMSRLQAADALSVMLDTWAGLLTPEFFPLPHSEQSATSTFQPLWIHPPVFGLAVQIHHASRILLLLNRPNLGGINEAMQQQAALDRHSGVICGIALMMSDFSSSIMSSQCLFIAGLCTHDQQRRKEIVRLIQDCRQRTGWPTVPLEIELKECWEGMGTV
ncbi:hypothetical protein DL98DRAFT_639679 [Cadophora sp. DSE1049]|nr:hypothetical protein DL98DRAFT_639679 [Cadophora sp. DSE1049]